MREQGVAAIGVMNNDDCRWFFGIDRAQPRAIIPATASPGSSRSPRRRRSSGRSWATARPGSADAVAILRRCVDGRLVEPDLGAVGERKGRHATPGLFRDQSCQSHALRCQRPDGGVEVVAQQVERVPRGIGGVHGELGGWQGEDEPTRAGGHGRQSERVTEEGARLVCLRAEDDRVDAARHGAHLPAACSRDIPHPASMRRGPRARPQGPRQRATEAAPRTRRTR